MDGASLGVAGAAAAAVHEPMQTRTNGASGDTLAGMATKKKAAAVAAPVDVPAALVAADGNKLVARAKASLAKKWSLTRDESLADTVHVAWFLLALGRDAEALDLVDHVADRVTFTDDRAVWSAASTVIALAARIARESGDEERHASLVARLVEHPAIAATPLPVFQKWVAEAMKDVRSAEVDPSQKFACEGFARGCARASYVRETADSGGYEPGSVDVEALERTITEGLDGLRAHLGR